MICESYPWKQDLLQRNQLFLEYNTAEHLEKDFEEAYTVLEKAIFYSAFIIRKLLDCQSKVSDGLDRYKIRVEKYKSIKKTHRLRVLPNEDSHDWEHPEDEEINGKEVCNLLIHSYAFSFLYSEEEAGIVIGFYVTSDRDRNSFLYYVNINDWLNYMDFVASDYVVSLYSEYNSNPKVDDYIFTEKKRGTLE